MRIGWQMQRKTLLDDRGSMPVVAAIFAVAFVAALTVVINHHQYLQGLAQAREVSFNAARAASQQLDNNTLFNDNEPVIDSGEALLAAEEIVAGYPDASIESLDVGGSEIEIVVVVQVNGILGSKTFESTGRATAVDPNR